MKELQPGDIRAKVRKPRMWDAELPVTGYVEGPLADWPQEMQDQIYAAMEEILVKTGVRELELLQSTCFFEDGLYVARITVMEKLGPNDVLVIHG